MKEKPNKSKATNEEARKAGRAEERAAILRFLRVRNMVAETYWLADIIETGAVGPAYRNKAAIRGGAK